MSSYGAGDIILVEIPYTDLSGTKKRPACILSFKRKDFLVAFITSRTAQAEKEDVILQAHSINGLAVDSAVLIGKLFTIHESLIIHKLGKCTNEEMRRILKAVIAWLEKGLG